jgi:ketosteroid isomerase-like protein
MSNGGTRHVDPEVRGQLLELVYAYARTVDARDVPGVLACFTPDAELELVSDGTIHRGHEAIAVFYREAFARPQLAPPAASTHLMGNTVLQPDGAGGAMHVETQAVIYLAKPDGEINVRGVTYTDRCVLRDDAWLFARRRHRLTWAGALPGGPAS